MTAQATTETQTSVELYETLLTAAREADMNTYGECLRKIAQYTASGMIEPHQRKAIVDELAGNKSVNAGTQLVKQALKKEEGEVQRAMQTALGYGSGIQGGRGVYTLKTDGVYISRASKDGAYTSPAKICGYLDVLAETYDTAHGNSGRWLSFKDTRGRLKTWAMPAQMAVGDGLEVIRTLANRGLWMRTGTEKDIVDYIMSISTDETMTCSISTGWVDGVFITPALIYGKDSDKYAYQPSGVVDNKVGKRGTLADWQAHVARYAKGNPLMMMAISQTFAGALLKPAGMMGFGTHLWSSSSDGKSTTMQIACSVWGSEFWQTWEATRVGLEGSAHAHNDLFLALDEVGQTTGKVVSATAYALANGEGKRRGNIDGNAKATKKWRVVFMSNGEKSLDAMMKDEGMVTRAGQEVRMINIRSDAWKHGAFNDLHGAEHGSEFSEMLKANAAKHYGTAGDAWLTAITQEGGIPADISQAVDTIRDAFLPNGAGGQVRRVARQFALTAYAGEMATKQGITGWVLGEATAAAKECFLSWVDDFGGVDGKREHRQVIEAVKVFLFANVSRFHDLKVSNKSIYAVRDRVGYIRNGVDGGSEYLVPPELLTQLADGYSREQIIAGLRTVGMINEPDKAGKLALTIRVQGKLGRYFVISA